MVQSSCAMSSLAILVLFANLLVAVSSKGQGSTVNHTLYLGVFLSNDTVDPSQTSIGFLPALDLAIESVNNHPEVLKNLNGVSYTLDVIKNDSKCEPSASVRGFIDQIFFKPIKIMLIGTSCSVSTAPIAELSPNWNLVQISPSASSSRLSSTSLFPNFLRTVSSDSEIVHGISGAMRKFGWSRIALITQSESIFQFFAADLREHFNDEAGDLRIIAEIQFNTDGNVEQAVAQLQKSAARVVFVNMYSTNALRVVCEAYRRSMTHPTYAWMFYNWYSNSWWKGANLSNCTFEIRKSFLEYSLVFDHYPRIRNKTMTNIANMNREVRLLVVTKILTLGIGNNLCFRPTFVDYEKEYHNRLDRDYPGAATNLFEDSVYTFDAVWTAALALHNASKLLGNNLTLMDFNYNSKNISMAIYDAAVSTSFFGLSGEVSFNRRNGDRIGQVRLLQYRCNDGNLSKVPFAEIYRGNTRSRLIFLPKENVGTVYPGDNIANDEEHSYIKAFLFATYTVLSAIGIVFACVMLIFNLWFRKQPYVKISSPYVNILIVVGAVMFYVVVILFGVDENTASFDTVNRLCHTRIWLCATAFSLLFGTIFAKTWRIYFILRHSKPNVVIKDTYLFLIVGILLLLDIIFLVVTTIVDKARLTRKEKELGTDDNDGSLPDIVGVCDADNSVFWLSILFAYKGFVLLAGLFLSFETRKIKQISLNESRFIAMSVYGAVIVSIALTPIGFLLGNFPNAQYAILGITILISVTIILGLVFLSKMYKVYEDPDGKHILDERNSDNKGTTIQTSNNKDRSDDVYSNKIEMLNMEIIELRNEIVQLRNQSSDNGPED